MVSYVYTYALYRVRNGPLHFSHEVGANPKMQFEHSKNTEVGIVNNKPNRKNLENICDIGRVNVLVKIFMIINSIYDLDRGNL